MLKLKTIHLIKILILYSLLALAAVFCYNSKRLLGPARKREFSCNDESLNKPFVKDTMQPEQVFIIAVYFPIIFIACCELFSSLAARKSLRNSPWILIYILKCCIYITLFLMGLALERIFKKVVKVKMARLRPNFLTVCDPMNEMDYRCVDMQEPAIMDDYKCSSNAYPSWAVNSVSASFPSGHASLISYGMIFLVCYLQFWYIKLREKNSSSTIVVLVAQISCIFLSLFVSISRVLDFRHHLSDVFAGYILGGSLALLMHKYLKGQWHKMHNWFHDIKGRPEEEKEDDYEYCCVSGAENVKEDAKENVKESEKRKECCAIEMIEEKPLSEENSLIGEQKPGEEKSLGEHQTISEETPLQTNSSPTCF